jgi:ABC-2 type transport system ATP-binding protein
MAEVEELCNRVAIIQSGKIVYEGEISALKRSAGAAYSVSTTDNDRAIQVARAQPGIENPRFQQGRVWFNASGENAVAELSQALVEAGALIVALTPQTATLEQLFFSLTEGPDGSDRAEPDVPAEPAEATT